MSASSEGSGESALMRRLTLAVVARAYNVLAYIWHMTAPDSTGFSHHWA